MKNITLCLFLISAVFSFPCKAHSGENLVFPVSTEIQIGRIKNLVDRAPPGIMLTVGGERAFRGASMYEAINYLIIFDISPTIITFNKINLELLKAANKEEYKQLRWESPFSKWREISQKLTEEDFAWWNENIRQIRIYVPERLNRFGNSNDYITIREKLMSVYPQLANQYGNYLRAYLHQVTWEDYEQHAKNLKNSLTKAEFEKFDVERKEQGSCLQSYIDDPVQATDWAQVLDYRDGNYLFNEKLYQRLHKLALENKISIIQADITTESGINAITSQIKKLKMKIGVLDLDNLYVYSYIGENKFKKVLSQVLDSGENNAILILMHNYLNHDCIQFSMYVGFTFENIRTWPQDFSFDAFIHSIPPDILPLLSGKLYEGNDKLPLYLMKQW